MGRPSKLTGAQWESINQRLLMGETARSLGREFGVSETAIRKKFGAHQKVSLQSSQVRTVAEKLAEANTALAALPVAQRSVAISLADRLQNISQSLACAAEHGAATAHRLAALANSEVAKIDDAAVLAPESLEAMKGVAALTKLSNEAAATGLNILAANRETVARVNSHEAESKPAPVRERLSLDEWRKAHGMAG